MEFIKCKEAMDLLSIYSDTHRGILQPMLDSIKEELEILDILKGNLYIEYGTGKFEGHELIECSLGKAHSGIDYLKVKEWLLYASCETTRHS